MPELGMFRSKDRGVRLIPPGYADPSAFLRWALAAAAAAGHRVAELEARLAYVEGLMVTDELTAACNRRGFVAELSRALGAARRGGQGGALIVCDLDGFKAVNDRFGHVIGDEVLRQVAAMLRRCVRNADVVARLGGDEFAVLLVGATRASALRRCQCLARALAAMPSPIPLAASFGVAAFDGSEDEVTLLHRADMAMYQDKRRHLGAAGLAGSIGRSQD